MLNEAKLIGRVGKDPEIRTINNSISVAKFSLATSETYTDKLGVKKEKTEWHNCEAWKECADNIGKLVKKGMKIYVSGKITYNEYPNKDGVNIRAAIISINKFELFSATKSQSEQSSGEQNIQSQAEISDPENDLPF